jgi:hypothetical protein
MLSLFGTVMATVQAIVMVAASIGANAVRQEIPDPTSPNKPACTLPRTISIGDEPMLEGTGQDSWFVFTVTSSGCGWAGTVQYETVLVGAADESDLELTKGSLTFTPGDLSDQSILIRVYGDDLAEPNEAFAVCLDTPSKSIDVQERMGYGTIIDDDSRGTPGAAWIYYRIHCSE